mmetsp:Transcript_17339/g.56750  ORF Transcript_17339/g.56750 Transcript_17339/m.56750 type:complete len:368 (+) Transcript_17339:74-1177(+)
MGICLRSLSTSSEAAAWARHSLWISSMRARLTSSCSMPLVVLANSVAATSWFISTSISIMAATLAWRSMSSSLASSLASMPSTAACTRCMRSPYSDSSTLSIFFWSWKSLARMRTSSTHSLTSVRSVRVRRSCSPRSAWRAPWSSTARSERRAASGRRSELVATPAPATEASPPATRSGSAGSMSAVAASPPSTTTAAGSAHCCQVWDKPAPERGARMSGRVLLSAWRVTAIASPGRHPGGHGASTDSFSAFRPRAPEEEVEEEELADEDEARLESSSSSSFGGRSLAGVTTVTRSSSAAGTSSVGVPHRNTRFAPSGASTSSSCTAASCAPRSSPTRLSARRTAPAVAPVASVDTRVARPEKRSYS